MWFNRALIKSHLSMRIKVKGCFHSAAHRCNCAGSLSSVVRATSGWQWAEATRWSDEAQSDRPGRDPHHRHNEQQQRSWCYDLCVCVWAHVWSFHHKCEQQWLFSAGANLILYGICDPAVTGWVGRLWPGCQSACMCLRACIANVHAHKNKPTSQNDK